jgi:hypothetical protein
MKEFCDDFVMNYSFPQTSWLKRERKLINDGHRLFPWNLPLATPMFVTLTPAVAVYFGILSSALATIHWIFCVFVLIWSCLILFDEFRDIRLYFRQVELEKFHRAADNCTFRDSESFYRFRDRVREFQRPKPPFLF